MKRILKILVGLIVILGILFLIARTPDTNMAEMKAKYGGEMAQFTDGNGLAVHYRDQGNPKGVPIIFIHGSNASLHTWEDVIASMPQDYRLISLDLPGHGLTGSHPQSSYGIEGLFDALEAVINELGLDNEQLVLAGNSMGGWVSWRYALENPERVQAMILIDAGGAPTTEEAPLNLGFRLMLNPLTRPLTEHITPRWIIRKSLEQTVHDPSIVSDEMIDRYWELLRYPGNRHATGLRALLSRKEAEFGSRLHEIQKPSLILWGATDQLIYVSSGHVFDSELPNSKLIVYPDIGHIPMEENPADVARDIASFLADSLLK